MRIQEISIQNYRQYQEETFLFPEKECDLHIIIGQNTLGKTNLLNSIAWCLFFEEPHLGIKYKAQPIVNIKKLNETSEGKRIEVKVTIKVQYDDSLLTFTREASFEKQGIGIVLRTNNLDVVQTNEAGINSWYLNDDADRIVNRFVPKGLQEFFFFDGEQLDTYFMSDKKGRIESSIYEISQVGLLNKIEEHLNSLILDLKRESGRGHPDIQALYELQETAKEKLSGIQNEMDLCQKQINTSEAVIALNTEYLKGQENVTDLEVNKFLLTERLEEVRKNLSENKIDLKDFIREYAIKLNLFPNIKKTLQIIEDKEANGELPPNIDRELLIKAIKDQKCSVCGNPLGDSGNIKIEDLLKDIKVSTEVSQILVKIKGPLTSIMADITMYPKKREVLLSKLQQSMHDEKAIGEQLSQIETQLLNCTDKEAIKNAINERKQHEDLKIENIKKLAILGERLKIADIEITDATEKYETALKKTNDLDDLIQCKRFAENALGVARESRNELMNEMREKIRIRMQDLFLKLIWRHNTYKEVILDNEYSLGLIHNDGYECLGSISAAERALLALSFTLALHDVSGFDSPLVIDTPVARISDVNRARFADVLHEISLKKELILLFTPSEYSSEIANIFDDCNSTKSILESKDEMVSHARRGL